jgi:hypothetical protein
MTRTEQQILFNALGYHSVIVMGEQQQKDCDKIARGRAWLIEEFCRATMPEVYGKSSDTISDDLSDQRIDALIDSFKTNLKDKEEALLPINRDSLLRIHERLQARAMAKLRASYSNDALADEILQIIDAEIDGEA